MDTIVAGSFHGVCLTPAASCESVLCARAASLSHHFFFFSQRVDSPVVTDHGHAQQ